MNRLVALRPELVTMLNKCQVIRVIPARGSISRAEIARLSGLSLPTVPKAVTKLLSVGLFEETVINAGHSEEVSAGLNGELHADAHSFPTPQRLPETDRNHREPVPAIAGKPRHDQTRVGVSLPGLIDARIDRARGRMQQGSVVAAVQNVTEVWRIGWIDQLSRG
jgi:N-acetylglucosamine repressor